MTVGELPTRADRIEKTKIELWGLYDVLKSCYLNVLYYGRRAATWAAWNLWLQIGASLGSLGAVGAFLAAGSEVAHGHEGYWKFAASVIGVISAVCAVIPAIMGHSERINRFERLHFAYSQLFQLVQLKLFDIKRHGVVTEEQLGVNKLLQDMYSWLGTLDESDFKKELRDECEKEVREKYPKDTLWYPTEDGGQETRAEAAITATEADTRGA